jgi:hypothetical protein
MKTLPLVILTAAVGVATAPAVAAWRWNADTRALADALGTNTHGESRGFATDVVRELPAPVAQYLLHVLPEGQPRILQANAVQEAEFFVNDAWRPLHATQRFSVSPPGFVWDARIGMAPMLSAYVRDAYVNQTGSMHATLLGLVDLANQKGRAELNAGALQRYLAEAVWFPTAFLPGSGVTWAPISDRAALATIADGSTSVSLEFRFNERAEVAEIAGPRFAEQNGEFVLREWRVRCHEYQRVEGVLIPVACEVSWQMPGGPLPYWRGRIVEMLYELAR